MSDKSKVDDEHAYCPALHVIIGGIVYNFKNKSQFSPDAELFRQLKQSGNRTGRYVK